jgi:phosphoadenosine phosphosulfate reductase
MEAVAAKKRAYTPQEIEQLNKKYRLLTAEQRVKELYNDFELAEVMLTSSFAATSAMLLKLFSDVEKQQPIFFIDTGYHFQETLIYKDYLQKLYELRIIDIRAEQDRHEKTTREQTWKSNPDYCCFVNKVEPLELLKSDYSVWVSGLMAWQSDHRSTLDVFEERKGILKFYPLLNITRDEREAFVKDHHLPFHPLVSKGYYSIGCSHCTQPGKGRSGRWNNSPKTECGLHL